MTYGAPSRTTLPATVASPLIPQSMQWHIITPEYPPQLGGVSDYTFQLAAGLARQGDEVHIWCSSARETLAEESRDGGPGTVTVHRECGGFSLADLRRTGQLLERFPAHRRLLVQWVPHGYGYRSMNLAFCWWIWRRAAGHGDRLEVMVHEPFFTFNWSSPLRNLIAVVHRVMTILLLRATSRVWLSIPGWEPMLKGYTLGRRIPFQWIPICSNIPAASDQSLTQAIRRRYADHETTLIGHFGTFGAGVTGVLGPILSALGQDPARQTFLLMGERSEQYRRELIQKEPRLEAVLQCTGKLSAWELSHHLSACDILIQPYPDGVSSRRTSLMAGLENSKPIVTTAGWVTEPLWRESDAVALAPAGDTEAFVNLVRRLRQEWAERLRLGSAAGELYRERFDISHTLASLRQAQVDSEGQCESS